MKRKCVPGLGSQTWLCIPARPSRCFLGQEQLFMSDDHPHLTGLQGGWDTDKSMVPSTLTPTSVSSL